MITAEERQQVLFEFNRTAAEYPREQTVNQLFEEQVRKNPQATAVAFGSEQVSYQLLNQRANRLARHLLIMGVAPDDPVGLYLERSIEMLVGVLGILKAGAAYLPLDPTLPQKRLSLIVQEARPGVVLTQQKFSARLSRFAARVISLDPDWPAIAELSAENCVANTGPSNLAYVMFTSGSSGAPKGVAVEHRSVVRLVKETNYVELGPGEVFLHLAPLAFDASTFEIWGCLLNGARLVVMPPGAPSLEQLGLALRDFGVTTLWLPAGLFHLMVEQRLDDLLGLKQLLAGGDVLSPSHVRKFLTRAGSTKLINGYGPTENTTFTCCQTLTQPTDVANTVPIGRPIANTRVYLLDEAMEPVPVAVVGELYAGGDGLARGYLNSAELTAKKFVPDPFSGESGARLYRTGDLARYLPNGAIAFIGRADRQVKLRGFRVEPDEVEKVLGAHPAVNQCAVVAREDGQGSKYLAAYFVTASKRRVIDRLRGYLKRELPAYMVPSAFVQLTSLPLTDNGKLDRAALPAPKSLGNSSSPRLVLPSTEIEKTIASVWRKILNVDEIGVHDNFFDLGGHSLLIVRLEYELQRLLQPELTVADLFEYPTVSSLARHLSARSELGRNDQAAPGPPAVPAAAPSAGGENAIAIVGMAARFPGCRDLDHFWENLCQGTELISVFSEEELSAAGVGSARLVDPKYVKAGSVLDRIEMFDASFFKFTAREAKLIDIQQRLFLECTWEALERAGYGADAGSMQVGVYAGAGANDYLAHIYSALGAIPPEASFEIQLSNDREQLAARTSYKLNLHGPSINVQTACSTSLVAVHLACQGLLRDECSIAVAGGVSARTVQKQGYLYQEGGINSPDGHCRAFDARAQGTVPGNGVGVVVLKRFDDAVGDGDHIHAIILGTAVNNDGSVKVGYTAPSVAGQAEVISQAFARSGVSPASVSYIEAHGTGTPLGDLVEMTALTKAFRALTCESNYCALGSVKTNIGHLGAAAGVAGLIKTVLALEHKMLPPSLNFEQPNPKINFADSPFYVNHTLRSWQVQKVPRRAGVSSFGIGGTNAHVVLEEAPAAATMEPSTASQLLVLSAKTNSALEAMTDRLVAYLEQKPGLNLADVAYTCQVGRQAFEHRRILVCNSIQDGLAALRDREPTRVFTRLTEIKEVDQGDEQERLLKQLTTVASTGSFAGASLRSSSEEQCDHASLLHALGQLWLRGGTIDWRRLHRSARRQRIPLPTYPFERQRHWIYSASSNAAANFPGRRSALQRREMADWFYVPVWKQSVPHQAPGGKTRGEGGRVLLFSDQCGLGRTIGERLNQAKHEVISVLAAERFGRPSDDVFVINPSERDDYFSLIAELRRLDKVPDKIIHLWSVTAEGSASSDRPVFEQVQTPTFYSLIYLAQALVELVLRQEPVEASCPRPLPIYVLSNGVHDVTGDEDLCPEKATILSPCKTIPQEYAGIACTNIDVVVPGAGSWQERRLLDCLLADFGTNGSEHIIAYRGTHRWIQTFEPLRHEGPPRVASRLRKNGVYLLTGGLGRDSLARARYLAENFQASLVLVGPSAMPQREDWDEWLATHADSNNVSSKIKKLRGLETLRSQVLVLSADVADQRQMLSVVDQIDLRFGALHGVIHAAGVTQAESSRQIAELTQADCEQHFRSKVYGLYVLEKILRGRELDFCLLTSSLASIRGGVGLTAYAAANAFMDAMAHRHNREDPVLWTSLNWQGVSPEETAEAFERLLALPPATQIITSVRDLQQDLDRWINGNSSPTRKSSTENSLLQRRARPNGELRGSETEETIACIWRDLLSTETVGFHDNFLAMGGDSLLAVQLLSRLRRAFGVDLTVRRFFEDPTIAGLARAVSSVAGSKFVSIPPLASAGRKERPPLSSAQRQLWFMNRLRPDDASYTVCEAFRLQGPLNLELVDRSLLEVVKRHEILRTTFRSVDNRLVQVIGGPAPTYLAFDDLSILREEKRSAEVLRLIDETLQRPFDLASGPLLRARVIRESSKAHVLLIVMHHIITDAWSLDVFNRELSLCYQALFERRPATLDVLTVQYADYAWWQPGWLNGAALEDQWAYWKGELVGMPDVLELPADRPRPPVRSNRGAVERFELSAKVSEKLKEISRGADATLFMTLLAAYGVLLAKYSGQRVIAVGSPVANRHPTEVENLIGFFANTLVLRVDLSGDPLFSELVGRVREASLGAFAHSDLPFDKLVERLRPPRDLSRTPLFQASFILNNVPHTGFALAGLTSSPVGLDTHTSKFDLTLGITEVDDGLRGAFEYSTDLFDAGTIRRMIKDLVTLLREIPRKLDERVENLLLMDKPDEQPVAPAAEAPETFAGWTIEKDADSSYVTADQLISEQLQVCAGQLQIMSRQLESLHRADEKPTLSPGPR